MQEICRKQGVGSILQELEKHVLGGGRNLWGGGGEREYGATQAKLNYRTNSFAAKLLKCHWNKQDLGHPKEGRQGHPCGGTCCTKRLTHGKVREPSASIWLRTLNPPWRNGKRLTGCKEQRQVVCLLQGLIRKCFHVVGSTALSLLPTSMLSSDPAGEKKL